MILVGARDLRDITADALKAVVAANDPTPSLFTLGNAQVRLRADADSPYLERLGRTGFRQVLGEIADWRFEKQTNDGVILIPVFPPEDVAANALATPGWPVPVVERIVEVPVFSPDGAIQTAPGYHSGSRTFYAPRPGFELPAVSQFPTVAEVEAARRLLIEDLLGDFPFVSAADLAHAVAALLLPFARAMFDGPTPLHLISAPVRGTGKSLLARSICFLPLGVEVPVQTEARSEEEWRKRIGAALSAGPVVIFYDNLLGRIASAALAAVLTSTVWTDRLLGRNDATIRFPNKALWIVTANNLDLSDEMVRRTIPVRLDAACEKPYERPPDDFRHPDIIGWARQTHPSLVWAALTLIRAWVAAGQPTGKASIGSFEGWAQVMGGILQVAGIPGFLGNIGEFRTGFDTESAGWGDLFTRLHATFGSKPFGAKDGLSVYRDGDDFLAIGVNDYTERSEETKFGLQLAKRRTAIYGGLRLEPAGTLRGGKRWRLVEVGRQGAG
jgi:hypothetical protein